MIKKLIDKVGVELCRMILGVGNSTVQEGVLKESGRLHISDTITERWLGYLLKLKGGRTAGSIQKNVLKITSKEKTPGHKGHTPN